MSNEVSNLANFGISIGERTSLVCTCTLALGASIAPYIQLYRFDKTRTIDKDMIRSPLLF